MAYLFGFLTIIAMLFLIGAMFLLIAWGIHLNQANKITIGYAWGNFDDFLRMYNSTKWTNIYEDFTTEWDSNMNVISWVSKNGVIRFNNIGMKLDLISFIRYTGWWMKKGISAPIKSYNPWGRK
jgi:hypothetical protein